MNPGCAVCDSFGRDHCFRRIGTASARACVFFYMKTCQKAWKSRKCGLRTRVPDIATRVPLKSRMDGENTETPVFGRLDLVFPKFALLLFALLWLWRARMIRHANAASHVPSDMAGEHDTPTPVFVRPRGRAPTSESGVREHTVHTPRSRCSSRTTRTQTKIKHTQMTTKAAFLVAFACTKKNPKSPC